MPKFGYYKSYGAKRMFGSHSYIYITFLHESRAICSNAVAWEIDEDAFALFLAIFVIADIDTKQYNN